MTDVTVHEVDKEREAAAYARAQAEVAREDARATLGVASERTDTTLGVAREETKRLVIKIVAVAAGIFACLLCLLSPVIVEFLKLLGAP